MSLKEVFNAAALGLERDIKVLYRGALTNDDLMWIVECDPIDLGKLMLSPRRWVKRLGDLPDWNTPYGDLIQAPTLLPHFVMELSQVAAPGESGRVIIEGISGTGLITVRPSKIGSIQLFLQIPYVLKEVRKAVPPVKGLKESSIHFLRGYAEQIANSSKDFHRAYGIDWDYMARDMQHGPGHYKEYKINVDTSDNKTGHFYGHMNVFDKRFEDPALRVSKVAAFACGRCWHQEGYIKMLDTKLTHTVTNVRTKERTPLAKGHVVQPTPIPLTATGTTSTGMTILYAGTDPSSNEACDVTNGPFTGSASDGTGTATPMTTVVKDYAAPV